MFRIPGKQFGSFVFLTDNGSANAVQYDAAKLVIKFHDIIHKFGAVRFQRVPTSTQDTTTHINVCSPAPSVKNWKSKVLLPTYPYWWQLAHSNHKEDTRAFLTVVTYSICVPTHHLCTHIRGAQHAAHRKPGCSSLDPTKMCLLWHTNAFVMLLGINMAMNAKILLLISKTISATDHGLCPWTSLGAQPPDFYC